jgi:hypothetical protein
MIGPRFVHTPRGCPKDEGVVVHEARTAPPPHTTLKALVSVIRHSMPITPYIGGKRRVCDHLHVRLLLHLRLELFGICWECGRTPLSRDAADKSI